MLNRITIFVCVFLLCISMAVPAFAAGAPGPAETVYAKMQIDSVALYGGMNDGAEFEWPFNNFCGGNTYFSFEDNDVANNKYASGYVDGSQYEIYGGFTPYDALGIQLNADYLYYDGKNSIELSGFDGETEFTGALVTFNVLKLEKDSLGNVVVSSRFVFWDSSNDTFLNDYFRDELYSLNIGDLLKEAYNRCEMLNLNEGEIYLFSDVHIRIYFESAWLDEGFMVRVPASDEPPRQLSYWVNRYGPSLDNASNGMFDWLIDTLGAFFDFEIAPGFSIDNLLYIFISVGLVLWFIKLIK